MSVRAAASAYGISKSSVGRILVIECGREYSQTRMVDNLATLVVMGTDVLIENFHELSPATQAVVVGIAADKLAKFSGAGAGPSHLTQVNVSNGLTPEQFTDLMRNITGNAPGSTINVEPTPSDL